MIADIGLEIHVQLDTRSKMFCACAVDLKAPPNTLVCPCCLGYPGALPIVNDAAVRLLVTAGLMLGCRINTRSKFDRKSYFYPDVSKNYQITQYDQPLCLGGALEFETGRGAGVILPGDADTTEGVKIVRLTRIHLEEDVAKNMHYQETSRIDFNRAGQALMEIVTEPDLHSAEETFAFLLALKQVLIYGGVSQCNLEEANMRCDVNCSVRSETSKRLGVKTEIKNMNTFKGVYQALQYEIKRQMQEVSAGGVIVQETRRWNPEAGVTEAMRVKENANDYRYFPDPNIAPLELAASQITAWENALPELPRARRARFEQAYALPAYDARVLVADKAVADFFEQSARLAAAREPSVAAKVISNWVMSDMLRILSERELEIKDALISPAALAELAWLVENRTINMPTARELFVKLFDEGGMPALIVEKQGLAQISDDAALLPMIEQVLREHSKSVDDYRAGKQAALQFLIGQTMRLCKGKANPKVVREMLEKKI